MRVTGPRVLLCQRLIHSEHLALHYVLVVHFGRDTDYAARRPAYVDEFDHRIGPKHMAIDGILIREHPLRETLAESGPADEHVLAGVERAQP